MSDINLFGTYLIHIEEIDESIIYEALEIQRQNITPIGKLALEHRVMNMHSVMAVLSEQACSNLRFGEVAVNMGYLNTNQLNDLLEHQMKDRIRLGDILVNMEVLKADERDKMLQGYHELMQGSK